MTEAFTTYILMAFAFFGLGIVCGFVLCFYLIAKGKEENDQRK